MIQMKPEQITKYHQLKDTRKQLEDDINDIENLSVETDFFLETGDILIEYFGGSKRETLEVEDNQSNQPTKTHASMLDFISKKSGEKGQKASNRADLYDEYMAKVNPRHIQSESRCWRDDFCLKCHEYREFISSESIYVCPNCFDEVVSVLESDKPSYKDPPYENIYYPYKRINHLKEQLSHCQASETTEIPQEVKDRILLETVKERKTNLANLTRARVKKYLTKYSHLGYAKYYDNINQIICELNGIPPVVMPPEVEEQFCNMFDKIQEPFERHCPPGRTNFLSYSYVVHKFCQLLGYTEYLPYFELLKSKDKLHEQDRIWKKICKDLDWPFRKSAR